MTLGISAQMMVSAVGNPGEGVENMNFDIDAKDIKVKLRRGSAFPYNFICKDDKGEDIVVSCDSFTK